MAPVKFKKLPKGFEFPLTGPEIRHFLKSTAANFEDVDFHGLSSTESYYNKSHNLNMNWVYYLKASYKESEWHFTLRVSGLRTERFKGRREEVAQAVLEQIRTWVDGKLALPETAPKKLCRANLYFDLTKKPRDIAKLTEWS